MPEISFARQTVEFEKIKNVPEKDVRDCLGMIFVKVANLAGFKEAINPINKQDIREMILIKYSSLSLEEIDYAFKLDRWSGKPVEHFQLFNSEYVAKVLERYRNWLRETRFNNNLPLVKAAEKKKDMDPEEKEILVINGILSFFEEFKETKIITPGRTYMYDYLFEKKILPAHTKKFKEQVRRSAVRNLYKSRNDNGRQESKIVKSVLQKIQLKQNKQSKLTVKCKELVLQYYFNLLIAQGKELSDEL